MMTILKNSHPLLTFASWFEEEQNWCNGCPYQHTRKPGKNLLETL